MAAYSIIKCYDTEENALDGGITGLIAGATTADTWPFGFIVNDSVGTVYNGVYNRADHVPFFIFNEYWFRIEANEAVMAFHIDWDDGEDNSAERSNFQIITNPEPRFWAITSHVFSKLGRFWPLIRAESVDGFVSKWYTSDQSTRLDGEDYKALLNIEYRTGASSVPHGANNSFIIREEKTTTTSGSVSARIPHIRPANLPPVAILKGDRRRIFAGIDNDQIEFRSGQKPLLYAYSELASLPAVTVTMEVEDEDTGQIQEYASVPLQNDASLLSWAEADTRLDAVPSGGQYGSGSFEVQTITFNIGDVPGEATTTNSYNKKYFRFGAGSAGASATTHIATLFHPIVAQVYTLTIDTVANGTGSAMEMSAAGTSGAGPYIDVYSTTGGTHRFWLDCSASQTAPSTPAPGYLEKIDISDATNDPDLGNDAIAALIATNMNNGILTGVGSEVSDQFTVTSLLNVITITNTSSAGTSWSATGFATGPAPVTFTKVTDGETAGVAQTLSAHTAIDVVFASQDSAATLAGLAATAINNNSNFTCTAEGPTITITQVVSGPITVQVVDTVNNTNDTNDAPVVIPTNGGNIDGTSSTGSLNSARRLYKAKLSDIDTLGDDDRIYIKVHNFDIAEGGLAKPVGTDNTVAILSNGNPIIDLTDPLIKTMLDGSESITRAGNVNIKNYYFDLDKNLLGTNVQSYTSQSVSAGVGELTGLMSVYYNNFNDPTKETMYTHHNTGFPLDSNGRFKDFSRLCRLQAEDDSVEFVIDKADSPTGRNDGDRITRSLLELTDTRVMPKAIITLRLKGRGSFTKGAKITQATTNATGYVLETTVNQNWLRLYNTSKISNYNSSGTAFVDNASAPYALSSDNSTDTGNLWILVGGMTLGTYRIPYDFFENNTSSYSLGTSNRSGISTHSDNFTTATTQLASAMTSTTATVNCDSTSAFKVNDTIRIESEYMKVTAVTDATNLQVKREYLLSGDVGHADDTSIYRGTGNLASVVAYNDDGTNPVSGGSATNQQWAESTWTTAITSMPENFIYISKSEKFSNIYMRMNHAFKPAAAVGAANGPAQIKLSMWYSQSVPPNKDSSIQLYDWRPLLFKDYTNELQTSGALNFVPPEDWAFCSSNDLTENNGTYDSTENWKGPISNDGVKTAYTPQYHILIGWTTNSAGSNTVSDMAIQNIWPFTNSHSLLLDIIDPHHVSLNDISLAQSISYKRDGKYVMIEDRLGKTDIRRIGASGGQVSFGGIDLGTAATGRNLIKSYQQNGTPIYLDIVHPDATKTRFFGVILGMSEDFPTGKMNPKWAVQMECSYCIEMSSTGVMTSEKIALGGVITDVSKYLLQS